MYLPYDEDSFDIASIAFGIRNVDNPSVALKEMARVVRPGGTVVVLEFAQPEGFTGVPFRFYSRYIMPAVAGAISGNRDAYTYLPEPSAKFPSHQACHELMREARTFQSILSVKITGGIY